MTDLYVYPVVARGWVVLSQPNVYKLDSELTVFIVDCL